MLQIKKKMATQPIDPLCGKRVTIFDLFFSSESTWPDYFSQTKDTTD